MIGWLRMSSRILRLFLKRTLEVGGCLIVMLPQLAQMQFLPAGFLLPHSSVNAGVPYADLLVLDTFDRENRQTNAGLRFLESPLLLTRSLLPRIGWLLRIGDLLCCDLAAANVLLHWRAPPTLSSSTGKPSPLG